MDIQAVNKDYHTIQNDIYSIVIQQMRKDKVPMLRLIMNHPLKTYTPFLLKNCGLRGKSWKKIYLKISGKIHAIYLMRKELLTTYIHRDKICVAHAMVLQDFKNICNINTDIIRTPEDIVYTYTKC